LPAEQAPGATRNPVGDGRFGCTGGGQTGPCGDTPFISPVCPAIAIPSFTLVDRRIAETDIVADRRACTGDAPTQR